MSGPRHQFGSTPGSVPITTGCRLAVRLTPRGGADRIDGVGPAGDLLVRVRAAPVEGAANRALAAVLAEALGLPRTAVAIQLGDRTRRKVVRVEGIDASAVTRCWPGLRCEDLTQRR